MVQNPLSSNDTVHWTVQIFQDDDWRRKEKRNLRHDRKIKSSVWTRHPIYEYHHPRVQIPVVCGEKKPRSYLSSVDEAKWESSTAVHFLARWWARLRPCLLLRELCDFAARFVWNFSLFAQNCASRSRTRKRNRGKCRMWHKEKEKMDSEMEISGVMSSGIAPVISVMTFLPETSGMAGTDMEEEDLYTRHKLLQRQLERMNRRIWSGSFWERKRRSSVSSRCR